MRRLQPANWPLATQLTVSITIIVMVVVFAITLLTVKREQQAFQEESEGQADVLLRTLSVSAGDYLHNLDVHYLTSMAADLLEVPTVLSVSFYDRQGHMVAHSGDPQPAGQPEVDPFGALVVASDDIVLDWQPDRLVAGRPVVIERQRLGAVSVEISDVLLRARVSNTVTVAVVVFVVAALAAVGVGMVVSRTVTDPVRELVAATQTIAQGDLGHEVVTKGAHEVNLLGDAFNSMTAHLREAIERLWRELDERRRAEERATASLREKEVLLRELHHRVKNNLQLTTSLLALQSRSASDVLVKRALNESRDRIHSMAVMHEILYKSQDLAEVDLGEYVEDLAAHLMQTYGGASQAVRMSTNVVDATLGVDVAMYCGLIIHELVANALQYAFPGGRAGEITVDLSLTGNGQVVLCVSDDGVGLPPGVEPGKTSTLGLELVTLLTQQLGGMIHIDRSDGTTYKILFSP